MTCFNLRASLIAGPLPYLPISEMAQMITT